MLINLFSPTDGTSSEVMDSMWSGPVYRTAIVTIIFALFAFSEKTITLNKRNGKSKTLFSVKARRIVSLLLSITMFISGIAYGVKKLELISLYKMFVLKSTFIEENYVDPASVKMEFPKTKRNLIHIYLESMENTYASKDLGGIMDENLIKPLTDLSKTGYSFSNTETLGGPVSTYGGTWSVASMVNMNSGLPMKISTGLNAYGKPGDFLSGSTMLGDVLKTQGYEQTFMIGSTAVFGGLKYMYEEHGGFNVIDYDYAIEHGWIPKDYKEWWGFEDDKLYEYAKKEITRLYETGKPFNFIMENADTHFPDGYVGKNTPMTREDQYSNVIAYSASEIVKFVKWIEDQPFYENTTIVLIGDHPTMDEKFISRIPKDYSRSTYNLILNPSPIVKDVKKDRLYNRVWTNIDMFPTIMASLGVKIEGERLALGTNLFSDKDTLLEEYDLKTFNDELEKKSVFYNDNILNGKYKEFDTKAITEY